ncbi:integration host factor, actinobacterial type [Olsenella sp. Marseille-P4559]|uniref:integration host factor, actinobacterial type n=1 Tax=Olsenella sp. Marseille-P4559 TaxID=2364795 RepID=UPI00103173DD|nr:integration host factor, actinobacterial type [Olsenella sp. Marseille-P4559]
MLPELTKEQRLANLDKSMALRKARAELRKQLGKGAMTVTDVISLAHGGDQAAKGMRVKQVINALPNYGFSRTQSLMKELHIADNRRVGGLGANQVRALVEKLDGVES